MKLQLFTLLIVTLIVRKRSHKNQRKTVNLLKKEEFFIIKLKI